MTRVGMPEVHFKASLMVPGVCNYMRKYSDIVVPYNMQQFVFG